MSERPAFRAVALGVLLALGASGCGAGARPSSAPLTASSGDTQPSCPEPNAEIRGSSACVSYQGDTRTVLFVAADGLSRVFSNVTEQCSSGLLDVSSTVVDRSSPHYGAINAEPYIITEICANGSPDPAEARTLNRHIPEQALP